MIHLQNVSKMSSRVLARGLEDVFARHLEGVLKTSWRRMDRMNIFFLTKTSWRRFEDVFWRRMITKNIFVFIKTSWRCLHQDECLLGNISFYYTRPMLNTTFYSVCNNKRIFHAFLFNTRNYSPEVINIQRRETELNIILLRMNNLTLNKKWMKYLFYYMPQTPNKIWEVKG